MRGDKAEVYDTVRVTLGAAWSDGLTRANTKLKGKRS